MPRIDVEFNAEGARLRGWLYPGRAGGRAPAVVLSHGFTAVKEMFLDDFAAAFAAAGLAVLVYDQRGFGASGTGAGQPRQEVDPWAQVRDLRHAITWLGLQDGVDAARIGVWGSSYSGGNALVAAALDRRVRCVVSQVPLVNGLENLRRLVRADVIAGLRTMFDADRAARFGGAEPTWIPAVNADPMGPAAMPTADALAWFTETAARRAPAWRNEVTLRSVEMYSEYEPAAWIARIGPTPLMMLVAEADHLTPTDLALQAWQQAREPKRLVMLPGGHFDAYAGPGFELASTAARDWFVEHLRP